jgi:hypothetical protein
VTAAKGFEEGGGDDEGWMNSIFGRPLEPVCSRVCVSVVSFGCVWEFNE